MKKFLLVLLALGVLVGTAMVMVPTEPAIA
jgi:hypothetical protein